MLVIGLDPPVKLPGTAGEVGGISPASAQKWIQSSSLSFEAPPFRSLLRKARDYILAKLKSLSWHLVLKDDELIPPRWQRCGSRQAAYSSRRPWKLVSSSGQRCFDLVKLGTRQRRLVETISASRYQTLRSLQSRQLNS